MQVRSWHFPRHTCVQEEQQQPGGCPVPAGGVLRPVLEAGAPSSASRGYLAAMDGFEAKLFPAASEQDPGPGGRAMRQVTGHAGSPRRRHAINTRVVVVGLCWKTGGIWESRGRWDEGSGSVVAGRRAACSPVGECEGRQLRQSSLQGPEGLRAGRRPAGRKLCKCNISVTM